MSRPDPRNTNEIKKAFGIEENPKTPEEVGKDQLPPAPPNNYKAPKSDPIGRKIERPFDNKR